MIKKEIVCLEWCNIQYTERELRMDKDFQTATCTYKNAARMKGTNYSYFVCTQRVTRNFRDWEREWVILKALQDDELMQPSRFNTTQFKKWEFNTNHFQKRDHFQYED